MTKNGRKNNKGKGGAVARSTGLVGNNLLAPRTVAIPRAIGVPAVNHTTHRYCEMGAITAALGALGTYVWKCNSLFDPDQTGGGHQPYGFDQFKTYYATYSVKRSRCYVECLSAVAASLAGLITSTEAAVASTLTAANLIMEPGRGQGGLVTTTPTRAFEARWDRDALYPDHDPGQLEALVSADPAKTDYYTLFLQDPFLTSSPVLYYTVVIEYEAEWKDPLTIASS